MSPRLALVTTVNHQFSSTTMAASSSTIAVTSENVNLTNCAREQIHIPNSIQNHGAMVIIEPEHWTVVQSSDNVERLLGWNHQEMIGKPITQWLSAMDLEKIQNCLHHDFQYINPLAVEVNQKQWELIVHENEGFVFLEFEPQRSPQGNNNFLQFYHLTKKAVDAMQASQNLQELADLIVEQVRAITGFSRVMVYRFAPDGSGQVLAESKQESLESFQGLHYPSTDIPEPARRLYQLNYIRLIPDIQEPGATLPVHPTTGEAFDLSYANLRSVSPIHVEYLENMGVRASMSISLIHDNRLWGLIACHNYTEPHYLPYSVRTACEFLGKVMSIHLVTKADREDLEHNLILKQRLSEMFQHLSQVSPSGDLRSPLCDRIEQLKTLVNAGGITIHLQDTQVSNGKIPTPAQITELMEWVKTQTNDNIFHCDRLPHRFPPAQEYADVASGIMVLFLSHITNSHIIWFRPEVPQLVNWGGNPEKSGILEEDGSITLSPRRSFDLWKQTVMGQSSPWLPCEIQQTQELRNFLVDIIFKNNYELVELNDELKRSNDELDSFAYVASHDLKEPLRGIYNYSYLLIDEFGGSLGDDGNRQLNTLMTLTKRMENLIDSLLQYSRLGRMELNIETIDLRHITQDIRHLLEASQSHQQDIRLKEPLPLVKGDPTLLKEVFMNLVTNAFKYNDQEKKWVEIGAIAHTTSPIFYVRDNGIGIPAKHQENIFRIFKRLHPQNLYGGGTGAGLTIVKKIIERHGGRIWLESERGKGSTFYFTLENPTS